MNETERATVLRARRAFKFPQHTPPKAYDGFPAFHVSAACYNHAPHIGRHVDRLMRFEEALLQALERSSPRVHAWCVLPNHYHVLLDVEDKGAKLKEELRKLHGRSSHAWNGEENTRGRKVFHDHSARGIASDGHFWATLNYVHNQPVHHGYTQKWQDWPWSSAPHFLEEHGAVFAEHLWKTYPVKKYGKGWDDPSV